MFFYLVYQVIFLIGFADLLNASGRCTDGSLYLQSSISMFVLPLQFLFFCVCVCVDLHVASLLPFRSPFSPITHWIFGCAEQMYCKSTQYSEMSQCSARE